MSPVSRLPKFTGRILVIAMLLAAAALTLLPFLG